MIVIAFIYWIKLSVPLQLDHNKEFIKLQGCIMKPNLDDDKEILDSDDKVHNKIVIKIKLIHVIFLMLSMVFFSWLIHEIKNSNKVELEPTVKYEDTQEYKVLSGYLEYKADKKDNSRVSGYSKAYNSVIDARREVCAQSDRLLRKNYSEAEIKSVCGR